MTNDHIRTLAATLGVRLRLNAEWPLHLSALRVQGDPHSGLIERWWVEAPGAVDNEGYMATLHELGHAAYFADHGMRIEVENLRANLDAYSWSDGRPPPTPYELEQEAAAHRWSFGHAEPGVDTVPNSTLVALSSYLSAARPEDLGDPRSLDFMLLIDELGVKTEMFAEYMKGRCPGCGQIHD